MSEGMNAITPTLHPHRAAEIAATLAYANTAGFTRAFTRWSGHGPSAWRRRHG